MIGECRRVTWGPTAAKIITLLRDKRWYTEGISLIFLNAESKECTRTRRCRDYCPAVDARHPTLAKTMDPYIQEMMEAGIIEKGYTIMNATLFPIWKDESRGIIRPIYDCRPLNAPLRGQTFVSPDIKQFLMLKEPGDYYAKIDLTNAYWHVER